MIYKYVVKQDYIVSPFSCIHLKDVFFPKNFHRVESFSIELNLKLVIEAETILRFCSAEIGLLKEKGVDPKEGHSQDVHFTIQYFSKPPEIILVSSRQVIIAEDSVFSALIKSCGGYPLLTKER